MHTFRRGDIDDESLVFRPHDNGNQISTVTFTEVGQLECLPPTVKFIDSSNRLVGATPSIVAGALA